MIVPLQLMCVYGETSSMSFHQRPPLSPFNFDVYNYQYTTVIVRFYRDLKTAKSTSLKYRKTAAFKRASLVNNVKTEVM